MATFNNVGIDTWGTYNLTATAGVPAFTATESSAFDITASRLIFPAGEPPNAQSGVNFDNVVHLYDEAGNHVTNQTGTSVNLSIIAGPADYTGGGSPKSANSTNGVVTFTNLRLNTPGNYQAQASARIAATAWRPWVPTIR